MAPLRDQKYTQFIGSSQVNVDQKGRISIPVRFRNLLLPEARDTLVLVQGLEQCVYGYPLDEWERLTNIFMSKSRSVEQSYRFNRRWALYTNTVTFDPQGRIPLPAHLRTFAKIENEAIVGGGVDHLEIWNPELLLQDIEKGEPSFVEMFAKARLESESSERSSSGKDADDDSSDSK